MADLRLDTPVDGTADLKFGSGCAGANLCMNTPWSGTADLNFGAGVTGIIVQVFADTIMPDVVVEALFTSDVLLSGDIALPEVAIESNLAPLYDFTQDGVVLPENELNTNVPYLVNVWRGVHVSPQFPHAQGVAAPVFAQNPWQIPNPIRPALLATWQYGANIRTEIYGTFRDPPRNEDFLIIPWGDTAATAQCEVRSRFRDLPRNEDSLVIPWGNTDPVNLERGLTYKNPPKRRDEIFGEWRETQLTEHSTLFPYIYPRKRRNEWRIPWAECVNIVALWPRGDIWIPPPLPPRIITGDLNFGCLFEANGNLYFGRVCSESGQQIIIPVQRTYIVIHNFEILRLPDNFPIPASRVALTLDADSWALGFTATLLGKEALAAVQPVDGEPVTLEIRINTRVWHVLVEDWTENREFGKRSVSVKGRGLSALLAAPYQLSTSGVTDADLTTQQLFESHLPLGAGWSIDWLQDTPDWLVPSGAWSWQNKTSIQALHEAAIGAGFVVIPYKAAKTLKIRPRYPVLPWDYAAATPDYTVPDSAILQLSRRQAIATQANAVFVHGGEVGGVLARVYLQGTAGDRVAQTQSSPLITDANVGARLLGGRILAGQYQQPDVRSVTLPLGGVFALGEIGQLLRVELDGTAHHGIINAVSIEAARAQNSTTIRQTLTIGEDTPNQWAKFKRLLPGDPLLTGVIEGDNNDGTVNVILTGGGTLRVRGTGTIGARVYVRSGRIEGPAPSMTAVDIEI